MQRVIVMRHGDRLDQAEPIWPANKPRPWDPPLTDAGLLRAWTVGKRIRAAAAADGWAVHRVLVSPFLRCRQTAARAVAALCAVPDDAALLAIEDAANVPLDTSRLKVRSKEISCRCMNLLFLQFNLLTVTAMKCLLQLHQETSALYIGPFPSFRCLLSMDCLR